MQDAIDKLASDVKATCIETAAKVAEIYRIPRPDNEWQRGYNQAVADVAAKILELKI